MFSPAERDRIWATALEQLRAERHTTPAATAPAYDQITTKPYFDQSCEILCEAMTQDRHRRLNEVGR